MQLLLLIGPEKQLSEEHRGADLATESYEALRESSFIDLRQQDEVWRELKPRCVSRSLAKVTFANHNESARETHHKKADRSVIILQPSLAQMTI